MTKSRLDMSSPPRDLNAAVGRAMLILEHLADAQSGASVTELGELLHVNRGLAFRILATLETAGYVFQDAQSLRYHLTYRISNLGLRYMAHSRLLDEPSHIITALAERTGELVRLAVVQGDALTWVMSASGSRGSNLQIDHVYSHDVVLNTHATGKAWLSALPEGEVTRLLALHGIAQSTDRSIVSVDELRLQFAEARKRGYASSHEEEELGISAVAAPIVRTVGSEQVCVGTVSVAAPTSRVPDGRLHEFGLEAARAALALSDAWPPQTADLVAVTTPRTRTT